MADSGKLMAGKRGVVFGVANNRSIAWGITKAVTDQGAEVALTYQGEAIKKRVEPLAQEIGSKLVLPCDVTDEATVEATFPGVFLQWKPDSASFVRLFVGRSKGGLKCSGGVCRIFPDFEGVKLETTLRF